MVAAKPKKMMKTTQPQALPLRGTQPPEATHSRHPPAADKLFGANKKQFPQQRRGTASHEAGRLA
jgi:hypothetical protein